MDLRAIPAEGTTGARARGSDSSSSSPRTPQVAMAVGFTFRFLSAAYISRLSFCVGMCFATAYINALSSVAAGWRTPHITITAPKSAAGQDTLPDLGHDLVSLVGKATWGDEFLRWYALPDLFADGFMLALVAFCCVHPLRFVVLRRVTVIWSALNALRALCVIVTSLPSSDPTCVAQFKDETGAYKLLEGEAALSHLLRRTWLVTLAPTDHITCGDSVFSGHATAMTMCAMVFSQYCHPQTWTGDIACTPGPCMHYFGAQRAPKLNGTMRMSALAQTPCEP